MTLFLVYMMLTGNSQNKTSMIPAITGTFLVEVTILLACIAFGL